MSAAARGLAYLHLIATALFAFLAMILALASVAMAPTQFSSRMLTARSGFVVLALVGLLASSSIRVFRLSSHGRSVNAALAASIFAYALVTTELILAVRYSARYHPKWDPFTEAPVPIAEADPYLGHVLLADATVPPYRTNSQRIRGREVPTAKAQQEVRIIAAGDSITFGWALGEADTYPHQLELLLRADAPRGVEYTVVNVGVPGYTSLQTLRLLRDRTTWLAPDLVILCVGWNDLSFAYRRDWSPEIALRAWRFDPAILRATRDLGGRLRDRMGPSRRAESGGPHREALLAFGRNLVETAGSLRERGVPLVMVDLPTVLSRRGATAEAMRKARLMPRVDHLMAFEGELEAVCRETGTPCILDIFHPDEASKEPFFRDHCHLTAEGSRVVAQRIYAFLKSDPRVAWLWSPARSRLRNR